MSVAELPGAAAVARAPAPAGADSAGETGAGAPVTLRLSVPSVHCAGCISAVERALTKMPGVRSARVNLSLKRVVVSADHGLEPAALIERLREAGYEARELDNDTLAATQTDKTGRELLSRLAVAGFAMMNVMLLSVAVWSGATDSARDLFHWISAMIALPAVAYSAVPFFRNAWRALQRLRLNMDVPISLAILLAAGLSLFETVQGGEQAYFDAALSLTFFLLAGRYLDHRTRMTARSAARELTALEVPRAVQLVDGREQQVAVADLHPGDLVRVYPGARIPADGRVVGGSSEFDRSLLTGESLPEPVAPGSDAYAGELNLTGPVTLEISATGADTTLRQISDLVAIAESARTRYNSLADRAAAIYAPAVHLLALAAFVGWFAASGDLRLSLNIAVAVLIITCPCALGLAVPAVTTAAAGRLYRAGILVKNATALERLSEIDLVVFDKTGTLTEGRPVLRDIADASMQERKIAKALAGASAHPLAMALSEGLKGIRPAPVRDLREIPGQGVEGTWKGLRVRLGHAAWTGAEPGEGTASYLSIGHDRHLRFGFVDRLRPGAVDAVRTFAELDIPVQLVSGDSLAAVTDLAARLGIGTFHARVSPAEKAEHIAALATAGHRVLMIGDGLNDTAALASAHVSLAPASALDASRVVSDLVLIGRDLSPIGHALVTARSSVRRIRENFAIAALYNTLAVPVALAGLATPLAAALAMSASSITVSLNALRLR